jgi:hypothetical protein
MTAWTTAITMRTPNATVNTVFSVTCEGRISLSMPGKAPIVGDPRPPVKRFELVGASGARYFCVQPRDRARSPALLQRARPSSQRAWTGDPAGCCSAI